MAQPHRHAADELERITHDFDRLVRDTRLGPRNQRQFDEFEERAQRIAAAIVAAFRGPAAAPSAKPLLLEERADGSIRAAW